MNDWGIVGHDWAVRRLKGAIERGQLAQSHLFVGPPSVGKATLALATARAVLGRDERARALVDARKHPDLSWVEPDDPGEAIKVEAIRGLLHTLTLAPVESRHRVAVVDEAHLITDSGKNAILKTLEEPNPSVVIILIAPGIDSVLPTIASRCQIMNLRPAPIQTIASALEHRGLPAERASFIARLSRGRVGWALRAVEDESLVERRHEHLNHLRAMLAANRTQRFAYAEKLARAEGAEIAELLEDWLLLWRDVTRLTSERSHGQPLFHEDQRTWVVELAGAVTPAHSAALMRATNDTLQHLSRNANARLALDVLLLKLPHLSSDEVERMAFTVARSR